MISSQKIKEHLSENLSNMDIFVYESVTSTNDLAKEYAKNNPQKEATIIALNQTAGRGRMGRSFFSPDGTGLYMSIVLRPSYTPEVSSLLTSAAAVATAIAIERICNKRTYIKWINDIFLDRKKVCGILCEAAFSDDTSKIDYVIVGIGINIQDPKDGFPEEIKDIATSIFGKDSHPENTYELLSANIINTLYEYASKLDERIFLTEYKNRLFMLGEEITVISPTETYNAIAIDIDNNAHLIIKTNDNTKKAISAGEISTRIT